MKGEKEWLHKKTDKVKAYLPALPKISRIFSSEWSSGKFSTKTVKIYGTPKLGANISQIKYITHYLGRDRRMMFAALDTFGSLTSGRWLRRFTFFPSWLTTCRLTRQIPKSVWVSSGISFSYRYMITLNNFYSYYL